MKNFKWLKIKYFIHLMLFALLVFVVFHSAIFYSGRSSSEIFDYLNRRLSGHTKLELVFNPLINMLRTYTGDFSKQEREAIYRDALGKRYFKRDIVFDYHPVIVTSAEGVFSYKTIADAAKNAPSGSTVEITGGHYQNANAVWKQDEITIRAIGGVAHLYAQGKSAEGKAIWVMKNKHAKIEGIAFYDAHVHDKNGAGIRHETGVLTIQNCRFENNENGILTTSSVGVLSVQDSVFIQNGHGDGYSHGIYVGSIEQLIIKNSEFISTYVGHQIKSRAQVSIIENVRIIDHHGLVSYELDFPNGGTVTVSSSYLEQGKNNENSVILSYGAEGLTHKKNSLTVRGNSFKNNANGGTFIRTVLGTDLVHVDRNTFDGAGINSIQGKTMNIHNNKLPVNLVFLGI